MRQRETERYTEREIIPFNRVKFIIQDTFMQREQKT